MKRYVDLYFTTCTIFEWKHLLRPNKYKDILIRSFEFFVQERSVDIFAFVIMPNHFHVVWQIQEPFKLGSIRQRLLKFTAQQIKWDLQDHHPQVLERFRVEQKDRSCQIWKRNPLSVAIYTDHVLQQKINYIHQNPCNPKWNLAASPEAYRYSSAAFFATGVKSWGFLS